jgi:hypothetical protein
MRNIPVFTKGSAGGWVFFSAVWLRLPQGAPGLTKEKAFLPAFRASASPANGGVRSLNGRSFCPGNDAKPVLKLAAKAQRLKLKSHQLRVRQCAESQEGALFLFGEGCGGVLKVERREAGEKSVLFSKALKRPTSFHCHVSRSRKVHLRRDVLLSGQVSRSSLAFLLLVGGNSAVPPDRQGQFGVRHSVIQG